MKNKWDVSWSRFRLVKMCEKRYEYALSNPRIEMKMGYHAMLGTLVQLFFERYFKGKENLKGVLVKSLIREQAEKLVEEKKHDVLTMEKLQESFGWVEKLKKDVGSMVVKGFECVEEAGILDQEVDSEVFIKASNNGLRMVGRVDFMYRDRQGKVHILEAKGSARKNADEEQLIFYALVLHMCKVEVASAKMLYWGFGKDGVVPVDVSPKALREFLDRYATVFSKLRRMKVSDVEMRAFPSEVNCKYCPYTDVCKDVYTEKEPDVCLN